MIRRIEFGLMAMIAAGLCSTARAQSREQPGAAEVEFGRALNPVGRSAGFGLEILQAPTPGAFIVDRFGLVHEIPYREPNSTVAVPRARARSRTAAPAAPARQGGRRLPTGSLEWTGERGVILYSPAMRYENYGGGYGRGPYGSVDCGMMYHGMSLGY